jgi:hypothetical protein
MRIGAPGGVCHPYVRTSCTHRLGGAHEVAEVIACVTSATCPQGLLLCAVFGADTSVTIGWTREDGVFSGGADLDGSGVDRMLRATWMSYAGTWRLHAAEPAQDGDAQPSPPDAEAQPACTADIVLDAVRKGPSV